VFEPRSNSSGANGSQVLRVGLFGAAPDTGNMGVSALYRSFLAAMADRLSSWEPLVFDFGLGLRRQLFRTGETETELLRFGARGGKRIYRPENLHTMSLLAGVPVAARVHEGLALIDSCDVVMDASAGDSFSDIYGQARFRATVLPKLISVKRKRPLVLLPQTYGPFRSSRNEAIARGALLGADQAWARDPRSFQIMKESLGQHFDPGRHRLGVDMAFGLPERQPPSHVTECLADWFAANEPLVGFNVSGLIWHLGTKAATHFGFKADYRALVLRSLEWLLRHTDGNVLLIPHVLARSGEAESDTDAARAILKELAHVSSIDDRLRIAPAGLDEQELKWIIRQCDWFCGTRMHATIAGLSSGVPTASIVYSDKAQGVFATCGQDDQVIDPRHHTTESALEHLQKCFVRRQQVRESLAIGIQSVRERWRVQMDEIAAFAVSSVGRRTKQRGLAQASSE
jgi:colanic acid/amylovoran biosynthesis protein